jgi:hypothetical protein
MATISKTRASLRFSGDDLDPEELSAVLGAQPSSSGRKGDVVTGAKTGQKSTKKTGDWMLRAEPRVPGDLETQIKEVLSQLTDDPKIWRGLKKYRPNLFVGLFMEEGNEGIEISAECLAMLGERGISLGLDIYHIT